MPHILQNKNLALHIDRPLENYHFSRFDWTGKIKLVQFQNKSLTTTENKRNLNELIMGKGLYNEFGIDAALGFEEAEIGDWFHKIGIGLLKKKGSEYKFSERYEIRPAKFTVTPASNRISINCQSEIINGYGYHLNKIITLQENGFRIQYQLKNKGIRPIITDEYVHNFMAIYQTVINPDYRLSFPFSLKPLLFEETVNPGQKVNIGSQHISFNNAPKKIFFFSNLSGNEQVKASWELQHSKLKIGIRETGDFLTNKINIWGWQHVISPELFFKIHLEVGQVKEWVRQYEIFKVK